jgi:predicted N-formylglutamate amidohydrolase
VLSCEHGGNDIPAEYRPLFRGANEALASHRGWDPGALALARAIARTTGAPRVFSTTSRLLVECNRSPDHPRLYSEFTRGLNSSQKSRIIAKHYTPHRKSVERTVRMSLQRSGRVLHIGVHTFTPVWKGRRRAVDIGVLFDPHRAFEAEMATSLVEAFKQRLPHLRVRRNLPYRGWTDGLTTTLRGRLPATRYAGIELEVSQGLVATRRWSSTRREIATAIAAVAEASRQTAGGGTGGGGAEGLTRRSGSRSRRSARLDCS